MAFDIGNPESVLNELTAVLNKYVNYKDPTVTALARDQAMRRASPWFVSVLNGEPGPAPGWAGAQLRKLTGGHLNKKAAGQVTSLLKKVKAAAYPGAKLGAPSAAVNIADLPQIPVAAGVGMGAARPGRAAPRPKAPRAPKTPPIQIAAERARIDGVKAAASQARRSAEAGTVPNLVQKLKEAMPRAVRGAPAAQAAPWVAAGVPSQTVFPFAAGARPAARAAGKAVSAAGGAMRGVPGQMPLPFTASTGGGAPSGSTGGPTVSRGVNTIPYSGGTPKGVAQPGMLSMRGAAGAKAGQVPKTAGKAAGVAGGGGIQAWLMKNWSTLAAIGGPMLVGQILQGVMGYAGQAREIEGAVEAAPSPEQMVTQAMLPRQQAEVDMLRQALMARMMGGQGVQLAAGESLVGGQEGR